VLTHALSCPHSHSLPSHSRAHTHTHTLTLTHLPTRARTHTHTHTHLTLSLIGLKSWNLPKTTGVAPSARHGHCAALVGKKIYVFAGKAKLALNDVGCLNCPSLAWSKPRVTGSAPMPRSGHTATPFGRAEILIFGGAYLTKCFGDAVVYNTTRNAWSVPAVSGSLPSPRHGHVAEAIGNKIYVFGGAAGRGEPNNELHQLDTTTWEWSQPAVSGVIAPRIGACSAVIGNCMYVIGGLTTGGKGFDMDVVHRFNADTMAWEQCSCPVKAPSARQYASAQVVNKAMIYVVSGAPAQAGKAVTSLNIFTPSR
jgi:N-acetylneuraminic acid mutarotase